MNGCDGYQIAIEMRLHGANDRSATERLNAHLAVCADCRNFEATVKETESSLRDSARSLADQMNWEQLRLRAQDSIKWYRRLPILFFFAAILVPLGRGLFWLEAWWRHAPLVGATWRDVLIAWAVLWGGFLAISAIRRREAREAETTREELIDFYRKQVKRQVRELWFLRIVLIVMFFLSILVLLWGHGSRGLPNSPPVIYPTVLALLGLVGSLFVHLVALPRLRREQEELG